MTAEEIATLPRLPRSVGDWEDLLVRLEIVPRVVRNTVEELIDERRAVPALAAATDREHTVGRWLEAASRVAGHTQNVSANFASDDQPDVLTLRFASLRARTFAMVQRRGLEVWEWQAPLPGCGSITAHQLLAWLSRCDAILLAELRQGVATRRVEC
jgi:hypothetical protein